MKNRKTVVVAFLLVAVMLLGVGYAALTDILTINGSAEVSQTAAEDAFNEDIYFSEAVAKEADNEASVDDTDNDKASFAANTLKGKGDKATFTFTIKNDGDVAATVTPELKSNTQADYFTVTNDWADTAKDLAAGGVITYTITVELIKTPTETISGSFQVDLNATSVDDTTT